MFQLYISTNLKRTFPVGVELGSAARATGVHAEATHVVVQTRVSFQGYASRVTFSSVGVLIELNVSQQKL